MWELAAVQQQRMKPGDTASSRGGIDLDRILEVRSAPAGPFAAGHAAR